MEKRHIIVGGIVALAAGAAVVRGLRPSNGGTQVAAPSFVAVRESPRPLSSAAERPTPIVVYVAGEIRRPGLYRLPPSARADDAVRAAGGVSANADQVAVNLAERLRDGEELVVPARGAEPAFSRSSAVARRGSPHHRSSHRGSSGRKPRKPPPDAPVDVNSADAAALETIPGIGPRLAERIVAFRESNGPFGSAEELLDVNGVSERLLEEISPYLTFGR